MRKITLIADGVSMFVRAMCIVVAGLSLGSVRVNAQRDLMSPREYAIRHYHPPGELETYARLRADVFQAVQMRNPLAAIAALRQITVIEPHDYMAWEALSYNYAVIGDINSAANVDLDMVSLFEFIPEARPQVSGAMARLQGSDPNGWQERVERIRASRLPQVPIEACDAVVEIVRPNISAESRRRLYTKIEAVFGRREDRVLFINRFKDGARAANMTREEIQTHATWNVVYQAITEIE